MARNLSPGYPNKHIRRENLLTIITDENGDTLSAILIDKINTKFYRFFILDMILLKIA